MLSVLITGGTGVIGKRLSSMLVEKGYHVIILTRQQSLINGEIKDKEAGLHYAYWNVEKSEIDKNAVTNTDYVIHLAGAGVADKRWTEKRKTEIVESRTKSSALLIKALRENDNKVKAVISASAIGWYGPDTTESLKRGFSESEKPTDDFLGNTCLLWEESIEPVMELGKRLVRLRTGIVLSNDGGAFAEFRKPLKAGIAAILGTGRQTISWIHIEDICRIYLYALENEKLEGIYNAAAPKPVNNKTLVLQIAKQLHGNFFVAMPVPAFILKIVLGEMSIEVLKSTTVSSKKIMAAGFKFLHPSIETAVEALINKPK